MIARGAVCVVERGCPPPSPTVSKRSFSLAALAFAAVAGFRFRLVDTAGSEIALVPYSVPRMREGETVHLHDGRGVTVLEVQDDERGQEGDIQATLVIDA